VYQTGGGVNAYNSLFADNGYDANMIGVLGPAGADYFSTGGAATLYNSILGSDAGGPGSVVLGSGSFVATTLLGPLANNGGSYALQTQTIKLLDGIAIGGGKNPINGVTLFTDQRGYVPTGAWDVGAYQTSGVVASAPTATLSAANVSVQDYGKTSYQFTVTYSGAAGITPSSLAGAVVQVVPPGGVGGPITAAVFSTVANGPTDPFGDAQSFTVTYKITPPGGSWTSADNGTYAVDLGGSPVSDTVGNTIPTGPLGTFMVQTGKIAITKYGLIHNPRTGLWTGTIKLTNTGTSAFSGPIFVLFNLPAGAVLANATGTYNGMPYLEVVIGSLAAGATTSATVVFNQLIAPGSYSTSYYLTSLGA
jgi:hypothetical protein